MNPWQIYTDALMDGNVTPELFKQLLRKAEEYAVLWTKANDDNKKLWELVDEKQNIITEREERINALVEHFRAGVDL